MKNVVLGPLVGSQTQHREYPEHDAIASFCHSASSLASSNKKTSCWRRIYHKVGFGQMELYALGALLIQSSCGVTTGRAIS
jgi:hypothetical protein